MNDQQVVERLRDGLDELTSSIGDEVPVLDGTESAPPPRHDARRWLVLAAAGLLIVVAGAGLWLTTRERSPADTATTGSTPARPAPTTPVERMPVPTTPEGWKVIEFGDVRLSAPRGWDAAMCDGASDPETVTLCGRGENYVTVGPEPLDGVAATDRRNGLDVAYLHADCAPVGNKPVLCDHLDVVDLDTRVEAVSTEPDTVDAILQSVGVSGRWRAAHEPLPPVPTDWREIWTPEGVTFSVPPNWTTLDADAPGVKARFLCFTELVEALAVVGGGRVACSAPTPPEEFGELVEAVRVAPSLELPDTWPVWDEIVDVNGTPVTVRVGFGEDSRIALAIIGSIRASEPDAATGNTVPGSTTPATVAPTGSERFDPLDIELTFETNEVPSGGELLSTMTVANHSGRDVTDPDCQLGAGAHALVPLDDPTAELWLQPVIDCGGPFAMPDGFEDSYEGPTFPATTSTGEPLQPGEYFAVLDIEGRTEPLRYPITVTDPVSNSVTPSTNPDEGEDTAGCRSEPGSPTDLSAEPADWLRHTQYTRWTDRNGCPVRVDVIAQYDGPEHCDWQQVQFLEIGDPIGTPLSGRNQPSNTYFWDPYGVLAYIDGIERSRTVELSGLPDTAVDTGFRQADDQLWLDPADPDHAYRVGADHADVLVRDSPRRLLCA